MADKQPLHVPSGEFWPLKAQVEGVKYRIVNHDTDQCLITNAKGDVSVSRCDDKASTWVIDPTNDGLYRFANVAEGTFLTQENCQDSEALGVNAAPWVASRCQRWSVDASHDGWFRFANERSIQNLQAANCSTQKGAAVVTGENRVSDCTDWRIEPVSHLAIVNAHSGRVVSAQQCDVKANACQQWQATSTSDGYYRLQSKQLTANKQAQCLVSVDGNLQLGGCEQADSEWRTEFMPNGSLRVVSRKGGSSMKVAGESYANGDNIVEDVWKNTISQQFYFREVK